MARKYYDREKSLLEALKRRGIYICYEGGLKVTYKLRECLRCEVEFPSKSNVNRLCLRCRDPEGVRDD